MDNIKQAAFAHGRITSKSKDLAKMCDELRQATEELAAAGRSAANSGIVFLERLGADDCASHRVCGSVPFFLSGLRIPSPSVSIEATTGYDFDTDCYSLQVTVFLSDGRTAEHAFKFAASKA